MTNRSTAQSRKYYRVVDEHRYDVIEIRVPWWSDGQQSSLTVEVYQHDTRKENRYARHWKTCPTTGSNVFHKNIGHFRPEQSQFWWPLRADPARR